jgi:hypothetical protein
LLGPRRAASGLRVTQKWWWGAVDEFERDSAALAVVLIAVGCRLPCTRDGVTPDQPARPGLVPLEGPSLAVMSIWVYVSTGQLVGLQTGKTK